MDTYLYDTVEAIYSVLLSHIVITQQLLISYETNSSEVAYAKLSISYTHKIKGLHTQL